MLNEMGEESKSKRVRLSERLALISRHFVKNKKINLMASEIVPDGTGQERRCDVSDDEKLFRISVSRWKLRLRLRTLMLRFPSRTKDGMKLPSVAVCSRLSGDLCLKDNFHLKIELRRDFFIIINGFIAIIRRGT